MAERPAPLVLVVQASPAEGLGTYAAVAATGQALLAAEMSLRLEALGAAVVPLAPVVPFAPDGPPAGQAFHWGRWYTTGARAALDAAATDGRRVEALGYTGAGALALVDDDYLHALISPIPGEVVANNRYSADAFAVAGDLDAALAGLERCRTDNAAVRCLEAAGFTWRDPGAGAGGGAGGGAGLWSRFDVDTPLDLALLRLACRLPGVRPLDPSVLGFLETATLPGGRRLEVRGLAGLGEVLRSRDAQLVVAGR
ncbi:MAG: hypothetical protein ACRDHD_08830, partial [Candidatus Limnocylindria bacterium]